MKFWKSFLKVYGERLEMGDQFCFGNISGWGKRPLMSTFLDYISFQLRNNSLYTIWECGMVRDGDGC